MSNIINTQEQVNEVVNEALLMAEFFALIHDEADIELLDAVSDKVTFLKERKATQEILNQPMGISVFTIDELDRTRGGGGG